MVYVGCDALGMSTAKLVEFGDGLQVFASSNIEARFLHEEIFQVGCYNDIVLPAEPFVIDAGANIGMFALYIKQRYPAAQILAFEPAPETAEVLRRNIELHGLDGISVYEMALGSIAEQQASFTYYPAIPGNSTLHPGQTGPAKEALGKIYTARVAERFYKGREITVDVQPLSAFLPAGRPVDLLKVDVEGSELDVLHGIEDAQWPLIRQAMLEVQGGDTRLTAVCDLLTRHGLEPSVGRGPQSDTDVPARLVHAVRR
jgi:FkbM family methyltransferase